MSLVPFLTVKISRAPLKTIIFVYNADSEPINRLEDYFHKIIKPKSIALEIGISSLL